MKTAKEAAEFYRKERAAGTWEPWKAEMLLMSMHSKAQLAELRRLMNAVDLEIETRV